METRYTGKNKTFFNVHFICFSIYASRKELKIKNKKEGKKKKDEKERQRFQFLQIKLINERFLANDGHVTCIRAVRAMKFSLPSRKIGDGEEKLLVKVGVKKSGLSWS